MEYLKENVDNGLWCFRALMVKKGVCSRGYYGDEKIDEVIGKHLDKRLMGLNLNLGSGFTNHYSNSVNLDISFYSLALNDKKGVLYNLNKINYDNSLPFKEGSFNSASMIGLWPYLKNPEKIFLELQRVVKSEGRVIIVNPNGLGVDKLRLRKSDSDSIIDETSRYFYRTYIEEVPFEGRKIDFIELELA